MSFSILVGRGIPEVECQDNVSRLDQARRDSVDDCIIVRTAEWSVGMCDDGKILVLDWITLGYSVFGQAFVVKTAVQRNVIVYRRDCKRKGGFCHLPSSQFGLSPDGQCDTYEHMLDRALVWKYAEVE